MIEMLKELGEVSPLSPIPHRFAVPLGLSFTNSNIHGVRNALVENEGPVAAESLKEPSRDPSIS